MEQHNSDEALVLLRRALATTEEALAAVTSLDQLQERFEAVVLPLIDEPEIWASARQGQVGARNQLLHARGCLEEMISQVAYGQTGEAQTKAWADQILDLNERLQAALNSAIQQAGQSYEAIRPTLISHYLRTATRSARWLDSWPNDAEFATQALERMAKESIRQTMAGTTTEDLDVQLARFRWEVGLPQQRIASIVGLSQPSVASRLARMESQISLEVAGEHIRQQADGEHLHITDWRVLPPRMGRGPAGDVVLRTDGCMVHLEILVVTGETGFGRRTSASLRGAPLDYLRLDSAERRQRTNERVVTGVAVYFRDRGMVGYYTAAEMADAIRQFRSLPAEAVIQSLRERREPAWTIADLIARAERPATNSERSEV